MGDRWQAGDGEGGTGRQCERDSEMREKARTKMIASDSATSEVAEPISNKETCTTTTVAANRSQRRHT